MNNQRKAVTLFDNQGKGRFVTVDYIAHMLCVSPKTIRGWILCNKIPSHKIGGARRFDLREIENWLSERSTDGHN